jgi:hypothetical protein
MLFQSTDGGWEYGIRDYKGEAVNCDYAALIEVGKHTGKYANLEEISVCLTSDGSRRNALKKDVVYSRSLECMIYKHDAEYLPKADDWILKK